MFFKATKVAVIAIENHFVISLDSVGSLGSPGQFCSMWCQQELQTSEDLTGLSSPGWLAHVTGGDS